MRPRPTARLWWSLLLFCTLFAGLLLAACGDTGGTTPAPPTATPVPPTATPSPSPTPKPAVKGDLLVWSWGAPSRGLQASVAGFNKQYPDVKVKIETLDRLDLYDQLTNSLTAGGVGLPDVITLETERVEAFNTKFPEGLTNLTDRAGQYEKDFDPARWAKTFIKGRVRAMPWDVAPFGLYFRTDMFQKAGIDPATIETWDDLIAAGKKLQAVYPNVKLLAFEPTRNDDLFKLMLNQQGYYYFNKDGKISLTTPAAISALTIIQKLQAANLLLTVDTPAALVAASKTGQVATQPAELWWSGELARSVPEMSGKWDVMLLPTVTRGGNRAAGLGGLTLAIPSKTKNIEAAWAFTEYNLATGEGQTNLYKSAKILPAFLPAYADPAFTATDSYFNNRFIRKIFSDELPQIPPVTFNVDNPLGLMYSQEALDAVLTKDVDPKTALEKAAEELKTKTGRDLEVQPDKK